MLAGRKALHSELLDGLHQNLAAPFALDFVFVDVPETVDNFAQKFDNIILWLNFEAFLDNIIAVIPLDDFVEILSVAELLDNFILNVAWSPVDAFFNELGAELILR